MFIYNYLMSQRPKPGAVTGGMIDSLGHNAGFAIGPTRALGNLEADFGTNA